MINAKLTRKKKTKKEKYKLINLFQNINFDLFSKFVSDCTDTKKEKYK